jgi:hypothetical protein
VLYRLLAAYKVRFHDPELKRASLLWVPFMLPSVIAKYAARLMGFSVSEWVDITLRIMFAVGILFALLGMIDIYEEQFRGSKLALAGILSLLCLCGPAALWRLSHLWFGVALPAETAWLALGGMSAFGVILSPALLLIASFRNPQE